MAITRGSIQGFEMKAYWDSASSADTPTWVEMPRIKDLTIGLTKNQADVSRRESDFQLFGGGQKDTTLEFGWQYRANIADGVDTVYDALLDSFLNNTPMQLLLVDGVVPPASGETTRGWKMWAVVFDFGDDQALQEGVVINVVMKPTDVYNGSGLLVPEKYLETTP